LSLTKRDLGRKLGRFMPAVLRAGRDKDPGDLAYQRVAGPKAARLVKELLHLTCHQAKACRRAEEDAVVVGQIRWGDGQGVILDEACAYADILGNRLGNAADVDGCSRHAAGTFGDGRGKRADMAVTRIIKHEYAGQLIIMWLRVAVTRKSGIELVSLTGPGANQTLRRLKNVRPSTRLSDGRERPKHAHPCPALLR
jgi:hypothetical protein